MRRHLARSDARRKQRPVVRTSDRVMSSVTLYVVREQHDFATRSQNLVHGLCIYLCIYLFTCVSVYLYIYLFIYSSIYLSPHSSVHLFIHPSIYLSIYLSVYLEKW